MLVTSVRNINGSTIALKIQFIFFYGMRYNFNNVTRKNTLKIGKYLKLIKNYVIQ